MSELDTDRVSKALRKFAEREAEEANKNTRDAIDAVMQRHPGLKRPGFPSDWTYHDFSKLAVLIAIGLLPYSSIRPHLEPNAQVKLGRLIGEIESRMLEHHERIRSDALFDLLDNIQNLMALVEEQE